MFVCGIGINDADYVVAKRKGNKIIWICPFYRAWKDMLKRCYNKTELKRHPTYVGCTVCEEWLTFSNFKVWMESQNWEGKQLDKDILGNGKLYNPKTCAFVLPSTNVFLTDCAASRGEYLIGVYRNKQNGKFRSQCRNPFTKKVEYLGYFHTELEAHFAWKKRKHEHACKLAELETNPRVTKALCMIYK
jgi:hypothetical protein